MSVKNLSELFRTLRRVRLAQENEGKELADFAKRQLMGIQGLGFGFDRGDDFFSLFRVYSNQYWVIVFLTANGSIEGTASMTRFKSKIGSEEKWIGYFADLRIDSSASPETRTQWRKTYSAIVEHLEDPEAEEHCDHLITAVFEENVKALHVLKTGVKNVIHHELCPYWNLSVLHSFGFSLKKFNIIKADIKFMEGLSYPPLSFNKILHQPLSIPLAVVKDSHHVVLTSIFGNAGSTRTFIMTNIRLGQRLIFWALSFLSSIKFTEATPWTIRFLSHLCWSPSSTLDDKLQALLSMIDFCFDRSPRDFHILNVTLMNRELCQKLRYYLPVSRVTAGKLFEITSSARKSKLQGHDFLFEGAYL